jgi:hypothetical protein
LNYMMLALRFDRVSAESVLDPCWRTGLFVEGDRKHAKRYLG